MIFVSIGLPTRFTDWCDAVVVRLVESALGPAALIGADTIEEIGVDLVRSSAPHLVIGSRCPNEAMRALLGSGNTLVIVALDRPVAAVHDLVTGYGLDIKAAIRAAGNSCAALLGAGALPGPLVLRADPEGRDAVAAASAIALALGLDLGRDQIAAAIEVTPGLDAMTEMDRVGPWWEALDPALRAIVSGALAGYGDQLGGPECGEMIWDRSLFWLGDDPARSADGPIELAGPARALVLGPDISLPAGDWNAVFTIGVSREETVTPFRAAVIAGPRHLPLAEIDIVPDGRGVCTAVIGFTVAAATEQPISLRVASTGDATAGRLALGNVTVAPRASTQADIPPELTSALGL